MDSENSSSQNAPYYRDPTTRFSVKQIPPKKANADSQLNPSKSVSSHAPLLHSLPISTSHDGNNFDSMFHNHEARSQSGSLSSNMDHGSQNRYIQSNESNIRNLYHGSAQNFQNSSERDLSIKENMNNAADKYRASYSSVSPNPSSDLAFGQHGLAKKYDSHGRNDFQSSFSDQSHQFNMHQEFVPQSYNSQFNATSNSQYGKQPLNDPSYGSNSRSSNDHDNSHLAGNNFHMNESWQNAGKKSSVGSNQGYHDHNRPFANSSQSSSTYHSSNSRSYPKDPLFGKSWANKHMQETNSPGSDAFAPPSYNQPQNSFSSTGPSGQSYLETARNTYNSAYNLLKQAESRSVPQSSSYSGPTFSSKPTYSGVYTNVRR